MRGIGTSTDPTLVIGTKMMLRGLPSSLRPHNSSFRRKPESRGEGWHQLHPNTSNDQVSFSYLGVPATAGMSDWYENGCFPPRPRESLVGAIRESPWVGSWSRLTRESLARVIGTKMMLRSVDGQHKRPP